MAEESPDQDGDRGLEEPPVSSGNGEPGVSGPGDLPQAQAQHGVVEVSLDDIDDGPGLIDNSVPGAACMPRTRQSRGGIMLDVAAGPPELVPLVAVGRAHVALQLTASA